ncbi:MAG: hypothetical protein KAT68_11060 [Bacteroidales bacterium]|nr:hypothetical protein [Bacteroidales bacterium]
MIISKKKAIILFIISVIAALIIFFISKLANQKEVQNNDDTDVTIEKISSIFIDYENIDKSNYDKSYFDIAFSGNSSTLLKGKNSYSASTIKKIKELACNNLKKIYFNSWIYPFSPSIKGHFVITVKSGKTKEKIIWKSEKFEKSDAKPNEWFEFDGIIEFEEKIYSPEDIVIIYFWNTDTTNFMVDDLYVNFCEDLNTGKQKTIFVNFETKQSFVNKQNLQKDIAHSGKYSSKVQGKDKYSSSIKKSISSISNFRNINEVAISAWVCSEQKTSDAVLVFTISDTLNNTVYWQGKTIQSNMIEPMKWFKIAAEFSIPKDKIDSSFQFQMYLWNRINTTVYADDFYIVFKKSKSITENINVYFDLTKETYEQYKKINFPPFKTNYFSKDNTPENEFLKSIFEDINNKEKSNIQNQIFSGNFITDKNHHDEIIYIKDFDNIKLFSLTEKESISCNYSLNLDISFQKDDYKIFIGDYDSDNYDEILIIDYLSDNFFIGSFSINNDLKFVNYNILGQENIRLRKLNICSGNFDNKKGDELFLINENGEWEILKFLDKQVKSLNKFSKTNSLEFIKLKNRNIKLISGNFYKKQINDELLIIANDSISNQYSIVYFDNNNEKIKPYYNELNANLGITTGLDTLKTTDQYFVGNFDDDPEEELLKYKRNWRFDLKLIEFNNDGFVIKEIIDFDGYEKDKNPKYYEKTDIFSGNFINNKFSSLLIFARNNPVNSFDINSGFDKMKYLPGIYQVYSPVLKME